MLRTALVVLRLDLHRRHSKLVWNNTDHPVLGQLCVIEDETFDCARQSWDEQVLA